MQKHLWVIPLLMVLWSCDSDDGPPPREIIMLSHTPIPGNFGTDIWGYIDPITNREYAVMGDFTNLTDGNITIVDVTDPVNPSIVSTLDEVIGFDIKISGQYAYVANSDFPSATDDSSRIVDVSDPANPMVVGAFQASHNVFTDGDHLFSTNESAPGLRIFDIGTDPTKPEMIWESPFESGSHDVAIIRGRMYDFREFDATYIYDISDVNKPLLLGEVRNEGTFHHSGWVTEDDNYLFICDETVEDPLPDVTIWDISDLANPELVGDISDPTSRVHNIYIIGELAYISYYGAGLKIFDISNPESPLLLDTFHTNLNNGSGIGNGFVGAFGVYPFSPNGLIFVSDMDNGLFVFEFR